MSNSSVKSKLDQWLSTIKGTTCFGSNHRRGEETIDDHEFSPEIQEILDGAVAMTTSFLKAVKHTERRDYKKAAKVIKVSLIPDDVKAILLGILALEEWDAIDTKFSTYKLRLGNAFCESCWQ